MNIGLLLTNVILVVSGQLMWKKAVSPITTWNGEAFFYLMKSPWFWGGTTLYVSTFVLWLYILSKMPFSIAYPFQSISYVLGIVFAFFFFKEAVSVTQWIGAIVIMIGVYLIAK